MKLSLAWLFALVVSLSATCFGADASATSERCEDVVLSSVFEKDGGLALRFDGYRALSLATGATISDATGAKIDSPEKLRIALGIEPDLSKAKAGDRFGDDLGDAFYGRVSVADGEVVEIAIERREKRPAIGIAWTGSDAVGSASRRIGEQILRSGGRVVFLTSAGTEERCEEVMRELDGFVMPGGADVDPERFGEKPYPHGSVGCDRARDDSDINATRWALENDLPGLWICRGEQVMNVACGGALIQDVPTYIGARVKCGELLEEDATVIPDEGAPATYGGKPTEPCDPPHYRAVWKEFKHGSGRHPLGTEDAPAISEDSKVLLPIVGRRFISSVVTSHHQAADPERLGEGLVVVARTPDGIVEAIEFQKNAFSLGIQFHAEFDPLNSDPEIARLGAAFFKALIRSARAPAEGL